MRQDGFPGCKSRRVAEVPDHDSTGYLSETYVQSMSEVGSPIRMPRSGGFLVRRPIAGTDAFDAVGAYPLFCCTDWSSLPDDLADLKEPVVSVVLVTDPFGPDDPAALAGGFSHGLVRYKDHFVIDLDNPLDRSACDHHRRNAYRALDRLSVEEIADPPAYLETWCNLYMGLIERHRITGISRFSRDAFRAQFDVPGLVAFKAVDKNSMTVGMVLWYLQGSVGYYHLAAYSPAGYAEKASYCAVLGRRRTPRGPRAMADTRGRGRGDMRRLRRTDSFQERVVVVGPRDVPRPSCRLADPL